MTIKITDRRRGKLPAPPLPRAKPEWVEAFMILLLHKTGGSLTVSLADLDRFGKLKANNKTLISFDSDNETVTIRAPEMKLPEEIVTPKTKIITEIN